MGFPIAIFPFTGKLDLGKLLHFIYEMRKVVFILQVGDAISILNIISSSSSSLIQ